MSSDGRRSSFDLVTWFDPTLYSRREVERSARVSLMAPRIVNPQNVNINGTAQWHSAPARMLSQSYGLSTSKSP